MGRRTNINPFGTVDGIRKNGSFAVITEKQATSKAYKALSDGAKYVLTVCKLCRQYHVGKDRNGDSRMINGDPLKFYFNRELQKRYGLSNPNKTRQELIELVKYGFIDIVTSGWTTRTKTVYIFSTKWQLLDQGEDIELSEAAKAFITGRKK